MGSINNYGVFIRVLQGDATGTVDDRNPALPIIRNVPLFPQFRILEDADSGKLYEDSAADISLLCQP